MRKHKYKIGQVVSFSPGLLGGAAPAGRYEITRLLPSETADWQYRVKSVTDGHERVVRESQIAT